jgi:hypothetical protein
LKHLPLIPLDAQIIQIIRVLISLPPPHLPEEEEEVHIISARAPSLLVRTEEKVSSAGTLWT